MNAPVGLRASLFAVGAKRRAELAASRPAAPLSPLAAVDARRSALTAKVARIQREMAGAKGKAREALGAEMVDTQAALTAVNAERRALSGNTGALDVPLRLVTDLLEILDRAQEAGFARTEAEHAIADAAAGWLEAQGRGQR